MVTHNDNININIKSYITILEYRNVSYQKSAVETIDVMYLIN